MSSLSHSMKVRSSIAPLPIGTVSVSGRSVRMKPPTCCDRCRGMPINCSASFIVRLRCGSVEVEPGVVGARILRDLGFHAAPDSWRRCAAQTSSLKPHHLADLADRRARAVVDDGRGDPGAVAAVLLVDVLDHLLAPLMLEIDVDVGRLAALLGNEALEQQVAGRRIDRGDAEAVADGAVRGRSAALAQDRRIEAPRESDDVVDGQEVAREVELLDQLQLVVELGQHLVGDALAPALAARPPRSDARDAAAASGRPAPSPADIRSAARRG